MDAIDFRQVVNRAGDRVERQENVVVDRSAREILIDRAYAYETDVYKALEDQGLGEPDLEDAAVDQFKDAAELHRELHGRTPGQRPVIDATVIAEGMRRRCRFVPWC